MNVPQPPVLEFPAMLHGLSGVILRKVRAQGKKWAREYLETGVFSLPRQTLQMAPGELLILHSGAEFEFVPRAHWRLYPFANVFVGLDVGVPEEAARSLAEAFESFCLSTPWGALYHAMAPPPPRSAQSMARRLAALLRFWDALQGPRYAFWFDRRYTLEELVEDLYGQTLEAWCPEAPGPVREHLLRTVERMARATRGDCLEAVLRAIRLLVEKDTGFEHREQLRDPDFLRERLAALSPADFEDISSAWSYTVTQRLALWDRALRGAPR